MRDLREAELGVIIVPEDSIDMLEKRWGEDGEWRWQMRHVENL